MHIYFSGIGGTAIGPLALIAKKAGYEISGSDLRDSQYIKYLLSNGISDIHIGQSKELIEQLHKVKPIDWFVYSSALPLTDPNHPELTFCKENNIRTSKRDDLLNEILNQKNLKLVAIAGTHGKTTSTAMTTWLFKQLGIPISYSVGAKISFGDMGEYDPNSQYFIYECDEFDRNFLSFSPYISNIIGIDWDHPDIYPTRAEYYQAFREFIAKSKTNIIWQEDVQKLNLPNNSQLHVLDSQAPEINSEIKLPGLVNRQNAWQVIYTVEHLTHQPINKLIDLINKFPGLSRRFEEIVPNLYTDYAHTPPKIRGTLQLASEIAGDNVVAIYEGLHNTRQHFIKKELATLFDGVKKLYIVPSFLARENKNMPMLLPRDLKDMLSDKSKEHTQTAKLNKELLRKIAHHLHQGDLVVGFSAGSGDSLDEWLRAEFAGG